MYWEIALSLFQNRSSFFESICIMLINVKKKFDLLHAYFFFYENHFFNYYAAHGFFFDSVI